MGGRGGSSGIGSGGSSGFDVTRNGETTRYYFSSKNGQHYYQVGIGGAPQPTPMNMSASEFRKKGGIQRRYCEKYLRVREKERPKSV